MVLTGKLCLKIRDPGVPGGREGTEGGGYGVISRSVLTGTRVYRGIG